MSESNNQSLLRRYEDAYRRLMTGGSESASACPFAPLRHNRNHGNSQYHSHHQSSNSHLIFNNNRHSHIHNNQLPSPASSRQPQPATSSHPRPHSIAVITPSLSHPHERTSDDYDDYLAALAGTDFSSPSLPPIGSSPSSVNPRDLRAVNSTAPPQFDLQTTEAMPRSGGTTQVDRTAASTRPRRSSRSSVSSTADPTTNTVDLTSPKIERARPSLSPTLASMQPPNSTSRKRSRASATPSTRRSQRASPTTLKTRVVKPVKSSSSAQRSSIPHEHDLFESSSVIGKGEDEDGDVLDLTKTDEVPAELLKPKVDNRTKLGKFQCVVCMDDVTSLTVTHCGHLFCSECLHSSLHIDSVKKTCPVCRTKVDMKPKPGGKQSKNSFYHLEMKLMTATRMGKRPVGS